ncbi:MAG: cyclase family protein, partial [Acidimicrobiia bacterium]
GAKWVVERGIQLVGTDFLSIEKRGAPGHPTHVTLLGAGVVIVEGLDLRQVAGGTYQFICLPLKIVDGDGAPARAVLIEE